MESNRKSKHREKEPSEERQSYYKRLRKEQKKKRKKSKNRLQEEIARNESSVARRTGIDPPRATKEEPKKRGFEKNFAPWKKDGLGIAAEEKRKAHAEYEERKKECRQSKENDRVIQKRNVRSGIYKNRPKSNF